jgi:hypothetical protein
MSSCDVCDVSANLATGPMADNLVPCGLPVQNRHGQETRTRLQPALQQAGDGSSGLSVPSECLTCRASTGNQSLKKPPRRSTYGSAFYPQKACTTCPVIGAMQALPAMGVRSAALLCAPRRDAARSCRSPSAGRDLSPARVIIARRHLGFCPFAPWQAAEACKGGPGCVPSCPAQRLRYSPPIGQNARAMRNKLVFHDNVRIDRLEIQQGKEPSDANRTPWPSTISLV